MYPKSRINKMPHLEIKGEDQEKIIVTDYNEGREVWVWKSIDYDRIFEFNGLQIDKETLYPLLNKLSPVLFMTIKKIVFINSKDDLDRLNKELDRRFSEEKLRDDKPCEYLFQEDIIVIYMTYILDYDKELFPNGPEEEKWKAVINESILVNIIYELRHSYQANPVFADEYVKMSKSEKDMEASRYTNHIFKGQIGSKGKQRIFVQ
jgi:hypothetical protein